MTLPQKINLTSSDFEMSDELAEKFADEVNEYLANKYGMLNEGWGYEIKLDGILWECDHEDIEFGEDDERGECKVCGATCDWHWETDVVNEGHDDDGNYTCQTAKVRVPDEWHEKGE